MEVRKDYDEGHARDEQLSFEILRIMANKRSGLILEEGPKYKVDLVGKNKHLFWEVEVRYLEKWQDTVFPYEDVNVPLRKNTKEYLINPDIFNYGCYACFSALFNNIATCPLSTLVEYRNNSYFNANKYVKKNERFFQVPRILWKYHYIPVSVLTEAINNLKKRLSAEYLAQFDRLEKWNTILDNRINHRKIIVELPHDTNQQREVVEEF